MENSSFHYSYWMVSFDARKNFEILDQFRIDLLKGFAYLEVLIGAVGF